MKQEEHHSLMVCEPNRLPVAEMAAAVGTLDANPLTRAKGENTANLPTGTDAPSTQFIH